MSGMFFSDFLFISTHISLDIISLVSAEANRHHGSLCSGLSIYDCERLLFTRVSFDLALIAG